MKYLLSIGIMVLFFTSFFTGCEKIQSHSATPEIEYKNFWVRDTIKIEGGTKIRLGTLNFSFVDGDGDFGLYKPDSGETDTTKLYNLYFKIFQKINGTFVQDTNLKSKPYYGILFSEVMRREGQDKTLKGTVAVDLEYIVINYDTIKYEFYIVDRAQNKSNVEESPELVLHPEPEK